MNWAFVDYENVRTLEFVNLATYQRVFVFCGPQNKSIKFDALPASGVCRVDIINVPTSSKNNVDFHLAFHLGIEHQHAAPEINFHVVSNDKGYQGLINHLELLGRSCKLVEPNASRKPESKRSASKKAPAKASRTKTPKSEVAASEKKPAAKPAALSPEKTPAIKTTASKPAAGRTANSKASTNKPRAAKAQGNGSGGSSSLSDSAAKLFSQLAATSTNRPKTKARVLSWLKSHINSLHLSPQPEPDTILTEWKDAGLLTLTGNTVSYPGK